MNVSMAETTADRFSVCMNSLRYVSSDVIAERSGLYQAVLWKFVEKRSKSGESVPQVPETRLACAARGSRLLPRVCRAQNPSRAARSVVWEHSVSFSE